MSRQLILLIITSNLLNWQRITNKFNNQLIINNKMLKSH